MLFIPCSEVSLSSLPLLNSLFLAPSFLPFLPVVSVIYSVNSIAFEDLNILLSYDDNYLNCIYELIRRSSVSKFSCVLLTKASSINFKLLNSVKNKLAIDIYDNQDLINLFSTKGNYKGISYFYNNQPITFIPIIQEEVYESEASISHYVDQIPDRVEFEYTRNNLLIGYDFISRQKIYIKDNETLLITTYDDEMIDKYRLLFIRNPNVVVKKYDESTPHMNDLLEQKIKYSKSYKFRIHL